MQQRKEISKKLAEMYGRLDASLEIAVRRRNGYLSVHDGAYTSIKVENIGAFEFRAEGNLNGEKIEIEATQRKVIDRIQNGLKGR